MEKEKKVGFFISPYVLSFNERIQINHTFIQDEEVITYCNTLKAFSDTYYERYQDKIPFFELTFLMALLHFKKGNIDIAVIECGLGGKLDATNCLKADISVITNIGYDHQAQLGNTLFDIATHKLGIVKEKGICFTAVDKELYPYFKDYADKINDKMFFIADEVSNICYNGEVCFTYHNEEYKTGLEGSFQAYNASLAISVIKYLYPKYSKTLIDKVFANMHFAGRFEEIRPNVILDGAHNVSAMSALVLAVKLRYPQKKIKVVFTALKDKAIQKMLEILDEIAEKYYFTTIEDKRATDLDFFASLTSKAFLSFPNYQTAIHTALMELAEDEILLITGSLHFISTARAYLLEK